MRWVSSRGWLLFIAMSIIWGIPYLLIKVAVEGVSVPVLVFARTAVGAAVLLPLALSSGIPRMVRQHWKAMLGFSFFEIIAAWFLLSDAERHLTSSMTGLLIAASPIIAAILDRFTGGEQRLSDFLLWESAYAELYFTDVAWPDFDAGALAHFAFDV